jgi:stage II sporulation protein D
MKGFLKVICFIGGALFLIPIMIVYAGGYQNENLLQQMTVQNQAGQSEDNKTSFIDQEKIIGVLAKEIPYTYEYETIKAQAVIIRTYLARRMLGIQNKGELAAYTEGEMKELWGENYEHIYATYYEAVKDTQNEMIFYDDEPIEALYHKACGGRTRSAEDVYHVQIPYLQSVASEGDTVSKQMELQKKEIVAKLIEVYPEIMIDENTLENQIQIVERDGTEYIKNIQIGNVIINGEQFRKLLELPSSNFKIYDKNSKLIFDIKGEGSGVGVSQNGANELAKGGKLYKDILKHYYTDVTVENYTYKK